MSSTEPPDPPDPPEDAGHHRPFRRRLLLNTASVGVANGWAMVTALISLPLVLRGLGPTAFGLWALLQTFSAVGGWFSLLDLGLSTATTREVAHRHALGDEPGIGTAIGSSLLMLTGLGLLCSVLLVALGPALFDGLFDTPSSLEHAMAVAIGAFSVQVLLDLVCGGLQAVLDGFQRVDLGRAVDIVRRTLVAVATSVAALVTEDLGKVAIASAAAVAVSTAVGALVAARVARGHRPRFEAATARSLLAYGKTVAVLRPLGVLHRSIDRFVVGAILGPAAVSLVEVATQLANGADAVLAASSYSVVPSAARLHAHGEQGKLRELTLVGTRYVLLVTWPVAVLVAVLAGPAIDIWVGSEFAAAATLTALAALAIAVVAPVQVGSNLLLGTGRAGSILRVALAGIAVNVVLSVALVHAIGVDGAFWATVASAAVTLPLLFLATRDAIELPARPFWVEAVGRALPTPVLAGIGAGLVVLAPLGSWATLIVGGCLGGAGALVGAAAWGLSPDERRAISRRAGKLLRRG